VRHVPRDRRGLTHHSLVQYRLPSTGELVPLLQIAPSKTDAERLLVVSPDLAEVLSAIITRLQQPDGKIPLTSRYDGHEHIWQPPAPLLFQRRGGTETRQISTGTVRNMLNAALARAGLTNAAGQQLIFTPHDFRRMFITDAILAGLPPHIAQVIAGHRDVNVTLGYKAVYPDEVIKNHLAFLARRRAQRPTEEYRTPTDDEWQQFLGHFERRKISAGLCGRAFATPCIHEHVPLTELTGSPSVLRPRSTDCDLWLVQARFGRARRCVWRRGCAVIACRRSTAGRGGTDAREQHDGPGHCGAGGGPGRPGRGDRRSAAALPARR
jgi:hypothetical protein